MKKLLVLLLLLSAPAFAGSLTVTTVDAGNATATITAGQHTAINYVRLVTNATSCASVGLPPTCTNAQVQAVNVNVFVYPNTAQFFLGLLTQSVVAQVAQTKEDDRQAFVAYWTALSPAQKAANCAVMSPVPSVCLP